MSRRPTYPFALIALAVASITLGAGRAQAMGAAVPSLFEPAPQPVVAQPTAAQAPVVAPATVPAPDVVPVIATPAAVAPVPAAQQPTPSPEPATAPAPQAPPSTPRAPATPRTPRAAQPAPQAPEAPVVADAPRAPRPKGQPINVRFEVLATDQSGTKPAITKSMAVTVADGEFARVRNGVESQPQGAPVRNAFFSVDVRAAVEGDRVRVDFSLDYNAFDDTTGVTATRTTANVRLQQALVLENGKPLVVSQSTDPMTDRKFTVEVKATVIR